MLNSRELIYNDRNQSRDHSDNGGGGGKRHKEKFWGDESAYTFLMVFTWVCAIVKIHQNEPF